ncbi:NIPSNAP family protein [Caballeronia pedi]|uniref:NIPSNAP family protein n=1 Tax=Caballeronia pedi TaxID=1777141 RepID=A0A158DTQ5_9BURK|nr:NIPSNAP family protein [Caballeronia pedi]SAK97954.1 NIPSNAP family protein [Caballeronia pedi]
MILEERIYRIRNGCMARYLKLVRDKGLEIQQPILGHLIGYFTTEIGVLSQVTHLWAYPSLDERARRRQCLAQDSRWQSFLPQLSELIEHAENRILVPTDFSPMTAFAPLSGAHEEIRRD